MATRTRKISTWHSGSWCCITITNLVTKCSVIQKISSGQTFTDILNLCCDLDLEHSTPIFPQNTPAYEAVLSWHWAQWTNFSAWHSGLWCCITTPGLVTKCAVVQKISSTQTFTNILHFVVILTLNAGIPFFHRSLWIMMLYYQVCLQTDQQFRGYCKNSHILII